MSTSGSDKRRAVQGLLKHGAVRVGLNPRCSGVVLPARFMDRVYLGLDYGDGVPMFNLSLNDCGIAATLLFGDVSFDTFVPWEAVFALRSACGEMLFADAVPPELTVSEPELSACGAASASYSSPSSDVPRFFN